MLIILEDLNVKRHLRRIQLNLQVVNFTFNFILIDYINIYRERESV